MGFVIFFHTIACVLLIAMILMQSGRGGGLTEGFASAETMLGAQTNTIMIRITTILAVMFLVTCLSLAYMSSDRDQSIMANVKPDASAAVDGLGSIDASDAPEDMGGLMAEGLETVEAVKEDVQEAAALIEEELIDSLPVENEQPAVESMEADVQGVQ